MGMHFWPNLSITRTHKAYNLNKVKANRPKGLKDEEWNAIVADEKLNKLIVLNKVPKASRKPSSKETKQ
jgi:hypothetical protein